MSIFDWYRRAQYSVGLGDHPAIRVFKKRAKEIHGSMPEKFSLMQAQERVAQEHGFNNWHHAQQVAKAYNKLSLEPARAAKDNYLKVVKGTNLQELRAAGARWLGYDALGGHHLGQTPSLERTHTLVIGGVLGSTYLQNWLHEHIQNDHHFFAWLNVESWGWTTPPDWLSNQDLNTGPLVVRFHNTNASAWSCTNVSIHWDALSELQAWMNSVAPDLAKSQHQRDMLDAMLAWIWDCAEGHARTGPFLATFLLPAFLERFPQWARDPHATLLLAGEVAIWLRAAQPFLHDNTGPVLNLSVREWITYAKGVIVLENNSPAQAAERACVHSWLMAYLGHCLGMPLVPANRYVPPGTRERTCHWYFVNTSTPCGLSSVAAQCRALGLGLTTFSSNIDAVDLSVKANSYTRLTQSGGSRTHAILELGGSAVPSFTVDAS